jgi:hypothetical protein
MSGMGKVKFCLGKVIWPAHIKTAIGFLVKPDQWAGMDYTPGAVDLVAAGDALLVKMTLVHNCQSVFKQENEAAHRLYLEKDLEYRQDKASKTKLQDMQSAFSDWKNKEQRYNDCKDLKSPERVPVLTRPGPLGSKTLSFVKYDGTVTPPQP